MRRREIPGGFLPTASAPPFLGTPLYGVGERLAKGDEEAGFAAPDGRRYD
jgi:hypothetical protein